MVHKHLPKKTSVKGVNTAVIIKSSPREDVEVCPKKIFNLGKTNDQVSPFQMECQLSTIDITSPTPVASTTITQVKLEN